MAQTESRRDAPRKSRNRFSASRTTKFGSHRASKSSTRPKDLVADLTDVAEARLPPSGGSQQDVLRAQLENRSSRRKLIHAPADKGSRPSPTSPHLLQHPSGLVPRSVPTNFASPNTSADRVVDRPAKSAIRNCADWLGRSTRSRTKKRLACLQQYPDFRSGLEWASSATVTM